MFFSCRRTSKRWFIRFYSTVGSWSVDLTQKYWIVLQDLYGHNVRVNLRFVITLCVRNIYYFQIRHFTVLCPIKEHEPIQFREGIDSGVSTVPGPASPPRTVHLNKNSSKKLIFRFWKLIFCSYRYVLGVTLNTVGRGITFRKIFKIQFWKYSIILQVILELWLSVGKNIVHTGVYT